MPNSKPLPPAGVDPDAAAAELLTRRRARASVLEYANAIEVPGRPVSDDPDGDDCEQFEPLAKPLAAHHRMILARVEATSRTPHGRLMVFTPPGAGKSTYASVVFPSWYLGAAPERRLILASYGDALASRMGRRTRSIVRQQRWQRIWNTELAADSHAAHAFALANGSEYLACGMLSGLTGNRAHGIVLDDPVRSREQADSEVVRDKVFDAYEDDLKTRLMPGGWIVLISTRWHEDDLAGRILPEGWHGESGRIACRDGNVWEVLCLQARSETDTDPLGRAKGEYLWPEWFDRKHWAQYEANPRTWASLYQQMPVPLEGDLFKPERLVPADIIPTTYIDWVRGWDLASIEGDGDWTAGAKLGRLADGRYVIGDMTRGRWGPDRRDAIIAGTAELDGARVRIDLPQDPGQAGKTQVLYLTRQLSGYRAASSPETGDKVTRAEPFAAQVNAGNVLMVRADWNPALVSELRAFPYGAHDDQVDALSRAFAQLIVRRPMRISDAALAAV
ncbi:phage terminase large subunit [Paraburkholderia sediminicola]|uniref:phage terminase large subunit n=1 Tax=Paraburkholderia sediminicola TaxID=458836 RepID=UPI0038BDC379